jgi:hypothetical protein
MKRSKQTPGVRRNLGSVHETRDRQSRSLDPALLNSLQELVALAGPHPSLARWTRRPPHSASRDSNPALLALETSLLQASSSPVPLPFRNRDCSLMSSGVSLGHSHARRGAAPQGSGLNDKAPSPWTEACPITGLGQRPPLCQRQK